jgi:hypothetical protein
MKIIIHNTDSIEDFSGNIPGDDLKTVNARCRAKLAIDMLNKAKSAGVSGEGLKKKDRKSGIWL